MMAHGMLLTSELKQTKRDSLALSGLGISNEKCACCGGFAGLSFRSSVSVFHGAGHPDAVFSRSIDLAGIQKLMSLYPWVFLSTKEEDETRSRIDLFNALQEVTSSFPDLISGIQGIHKAQNPQLLPAATPCPQYGTTLGTAQQMAAQSYPVQAPPDNFRFQHGHVATHGQAVITSSIATPQPKKLHAYQFESSLPPSDDDFIVPSSDTLCSSPFQVISKIKV